MSQKAALNPSAAPWKPPPPPVQPSPPFTSTAAPFVPTTPPPQASLTQKPMKLSANAPEFPAPFPPAYSNPWPYPPEMPSVSVFPHFVPVDPYPYTQFPPRMPIAHTPYAPTPVPPRPSHPPSERLIQAVPLAPKAADPLPVHAPAPGPPPPALPVEAAPPVTPFHPPEESTALPTTPIVMPSPPVAELPVPTKPVEVPPSEPTALPAETPAGKTPEPETEKPQDAVKSVAEPVKPVAEPAADTVSQPVPTQPSQPLPPASESPCPAATLSPGPLAEAAVPASPTEGRKALLPTPVGVKPMLPLSMSPSLPLKVETSPRTPGRGVTDSGDDQDASEADDEGDGAPGRRVYTQDFMRSLRHQHKDRPHGLPDLGIVIGSNPDADDRTRSSKPSPRRQRNPQYNSNKPMIPLIPENVPIAPLVKSENRWQPSKPTTDEEAVLKLSMGILNRLTPTNFDDLVTKLLAVKLDSPALREGLIEQIFNKCVTEQSYVTVYADMIVKLIQALSDDDPALDFRRVLIHKAQDTFMSARVTEGLTAEEAHRKKLFVLGNVRLIGELLVRFVLGERIAYSCLDFLLPEDEDPAEDKVESACKLLTTVGKLLDTSTKMVTELAIAWQRFSKLQSDERLSVRIRFMVLDVLELRKNKWVPRMLKTAAPKKIEDLHHEHEVEQAKKAADTAHRDRQPRPFRDTAAHRKHTETADDQSWEVQKKERRHPKRGGFGRGSDRGFGDRRREDGPRDGGDRDRRRNQPTPPPQTAVSSAPRSGFERLANMDTGDEDEDSDSTANTASEDRDALTVSQESSRQSSPAPTLSVEDAIEEARAFVNNGGEYSAPPNVSWTPSDLERLFSDLLNAAVDSKDGGPERFAEFLFALRRGMTQDVILAGVKSFVEVFDDVLIDVPRLPVSFGELCGAVVCRGLVPLGPMAQAARALQPAHAVAVVGNMLRYLTQKLKDEAFRDAVITSDFKLSALVTSKKDREAFVSEYKLDKYKSILL